MFHSHFRTQPQCCLFPDAQAESGAPPLKLPLWVITVWGWVCVPHWAVSPKRTGAGLSVSPAPRAGTLGMSGC